MGSFLAWLQSFWNAWDIRLLVLCSLALQMVLTVMGSRRKYLKAPWINIVLWFAYLAADSVATIALGNLSHATAGQNNKINPNVVLKALWAPLLLTHLGGPDTITAYSIEDNQLWLRHLLSVVIQLSVAIYVLFISWNSSWLSILAIVLFLAGIIKYGERTWVLMSANKSQQKYVDVSQEVEDLVKVPQDLLRKIPRADFLLIGYGLFRGLTPCLSNYTKLATLRKVTRHGVNMGVYIALTQGKSESIFKVIEIELAFMFDVLYTKAILINSLAGTILRLISFTCVVSTLIGFSILSKLGYNKINVFIIYVLLVGAVALEIYGFLLRISSDWAIIWMLKNHDKVRIFPILARLLLKHRKKYWSDSVRQFNLFKYFKYFTYEEKPTPFLRLLKHLGMDEIFIKFKCQSHVADIKDLKNFILDWFGEIGNEITKGSITGRGQLALQRFASSSWDGVYEYKDFDSSLMMWEVVTIIMYEKDEETNNIVADKEVNEKRDMCKVISDYMMYLLLNHPYMLRIANQDDTLDTGRKILNSLSDLNLRTMKEFDSPQLAAFPEEFVLSHLMHEDASKRWKILSAVWVEMLCYGAAHCHPYDHARPLSQGGELLTHMWVLLTMHALTDKFTSTNY